MPPGNGMAFIIVQHLDPSHDSLMVELLAGHTAMPVLQVTDGMAIAREHVYLIPPGVYLSADDKGALRLSRPQAPHGARLAFDFLLNSLAIEYGARVVCVVLSGTGADGSLGLKAVKANGGFVIAQDVGEADYDGMPRSAIATGAVDLVASAAKIAEALVQRVQGEALAPPPNALRSPNSVQELLPKIIDLLRTKTAHDFTLYKRGTLERRVARRMAIAATRSADAYLDLLLRDADEREQLAKDLLINVTGFFRDAPVFDVLEKKVIPDLVRESCFGSTPADLGRRLQLRRGDLLPRHAVPGADQRVQARRQNAALRQRRRSRCGGDRALRPLSAIDRGRSVLGSIGRILHQRRSFL